MVLYLTIAVNRLEEQAVSTVRLRPLRLQIEVHKTNSIQNVSFSVESCAIIGIQGIRDLNKKLQFYPTQLWFHSSSTSSIYLIPVNTY